MTAYVALLRAVNLGPHNRLAMSDLKRICEEAGLRGVRTYIASGNVVFASSSTQPAIKSELERRLKAHAGKPLHLLIRSAGEMASIVADFPFRDAPPARSVAIFLDDKPPPDALERLSGRQDERVATGRREIYVAYGESGIGRSKLTIPAAANGTARNMNTVAKLAEMVRQLED